MTSSPSTTTSLRTASVPGRGELMPNIMGQSAGGDAVQLRDFYMRRNLAVLFVQHDDVGASWLEAAAAQRDKAAEAVGEIVVVVPPGMDSHGLHTIVDVDGALRARFGLDIGDLPAIFIADRYLTIFAANRGHDAVVDLMPQQIPEWLVFISCRCT